LRLVNASDGFQIWSQSYDRDLTNILSLQDDIARAITRAVSERFLGRAVVANRGPKPRVIDPEAYKASSPIEFAEGLLLKNRAYLFFFVWRALAENQFSNFVKQGRGRVPQVSLQFFHALEVDQLRKLIARELQELRHFPINICSARRWRQFLPSQQLGNIRLRNFGGSR